MKPVGDAIALISGMIESESNVAENQVESMEKLIAGMSNKDIKALREKLFPSGKPDADDSEGEDEDEDEDANEGEDEDEDEDEGGKK